MERKPKSSSLAATPKQRADRLVGQKYPNLTGRHIEEALQDGLVLQKNGKRIKKGDRLEASDLDGRALESHLKDLKKGDPTLVLSVLVETESWLAVDKPSGIPSHPLSLWDRHTVTHWALARYPSVGAEFTSVQPTITPHRLDTDTSGVLVVAKNKAAYEDWRRAFESKTIEKTYLAWCWGSPEREFYSCDLPIAHAPGKDPKMTVVESAKRVSPPVLPATTSLKVLTRRKNGIFLAKVFCRTGVTHQVRVHLAYMGFPLVGDKKYDPLWDERPLHENTHWLRACELKREDELISADQKEFESKVW